MELETLQTPALVLNRSVMEQNMRRVQAIADRRQLALRPHMKTAKSADIADYALELGAKGITVSTLNEAAYFVKNGIKDITYAVSITPDKLMRVAHLQRNGAKVAIIIDSMEMASRVASEAAALDARFHVWLEIDCGQNRTGMPQEHPQIPAVAKVLEDAARIDFKGIMTHAGQSYACRSIEAIAQVAELERLAAVHTAQKLRIAGIDCPNVRVGSTPTVLHGKSSEGLTELCAGVYMFMDLFQVGIGSGSEADLALSVLVSVISHRNDGSLVVDAGSLALSLDRSTAKVDTDLGFGLLADLHGRILEPRVTVVDVNQEHGILRSEKALDPADYPIGSRLRIFPNHACMTAAMYDRYHVVSGHSLSVETVWERVNGW